MEVRRLAIVGASARAAAFSAIRAGYEVVAADLFADADLERIAQVTRVERYPEGLADWLAAIDCDAWMYTGALENYPDLVDRMAALRPLVGNRGETLKAVRDPFRLASALADAGVAFPETRRWSDGLPLDGSWLCKTYRGASGSGVWALDGEDALARAERDGAVFQQRLDGRVWSTAALFALGPERSEVLGNTMQFTGEHLIGRGKPWQYVGSYTPFMITAALVEQFVRLRDVLSRHFGLRGLAGVDAIVDDHDRLWVLEVNPRYTASVEVVERMTNRSAIAAHLATFGCADWEAFGPPVRTEINAMPVRSFGKEIVFAKHAVTVTEAFHQWAMSHSTIDLAKLTIADIPHSGETIGEGHPVLTVLADGPNYFCGEYMRTRIAEVEKRLYETK